MFVQIWVACSNRINFTYCCLFILSLHNALNSCACNTHCGWAVDSAPGNCILSLHYYFITVYVLPADNTVFP